MSKEFPNPGRGYLIREYLGGGAMKEAYRATSPVGLRDVAILRYINKNDEVEMENDFKILRRLRNTPYSEYLGYPEMFFQGDDKSLYFAEELLARPLDSLAPMKNGARVIRIARDLFRGLQCLHAQNLKHSDLKLDNCGLDGQGRAKIFDLSSVASEPGDNIRGAVLTRAPEYFRDKSKYELAGDVWALGATVFALRTGSYPFVTKDEINDRIGIGKMARSLDPSVREKAELQKKEFDDRVTGRALADRADEHLNQRILETLPGESGELLQRILSFVPELRPAASDCAREWAAMSDQPLAASSGDVQGNHENFRRLERYLQKILDGYITVTDQQWDRLVDNYEKLDSEAPNDSLGTPIKEMIKKVQAKRLALMRI